MDSDSWVKILNQYTLRKSGLIEWQQNKRIGRQHKLGKLSARERIEVLVDRGTFKELDLFVQHRCTNFGMTSESAPTDGVVTGIAKIEDRDVCLFSQDFTILGGTVGEAHAAKILKVMNLAAKIGIPIIGINDSGGGRIQEGYDAQHGYAQIFYNNVELSGVIPQISVILGPCAGGASYSPALTDFIFMTEKISYMFLTGPRVIKDVIGEDIDEFELGGCSIHTEKSGLAHFSMESEVECFSGVKKLLSYLPSNFNEKPPKREFSEEANVKNERLTEIVPTNPRRGYDMVQVIRELVDNTEFLEVHRKWAQNIIVGFARIYGQPIGIVGNQPKILAGALDIDAAVKAARFVRFCDSFNLPLITLVDTPAFLPGKNQEYGGVIRHGAKLLYAYSEASVPKITVILRKAYGGGYVVMCPIGLRADLVIAWPTAEIAMMGAEGAADIIFHREIINSSNPSLTRKIKIDEFKELFGTPYGAAARGYIDEIIDPRDTRIVIAHSLQVLNKKKIISAPKKHGNIPL